MNVRTAFEECDCPLMVCRALPVLVSPSSAAAGREVAVRNSPSKLVPQLKLSSSSCHVVVAVAEHDSQEFRKQSEDYYKVSQSLRRR